MERSDPHVASLLRSPFPMTSGQGPQGTSACPSLGQILPFFSLHFFSALSSAALVWSMLVCVLVFTGVQQD